MSELTLVSLFDGIAGFPLAFSRAGVRAIATVEIDKAAAGVAAEHFPKAEHFDDVTEVTGDQLRAAGFDPARGVLTAGWPCTDLSLAGLRLGLGGARSGLVGEVFRILGELRPRWFVLENVPGLLSSVCPCPGGGVCDDAGCGEPHTVRRGACGRRRGRDGRLAGPGRCMALHGGGMGTVLRSLVKLGYGVAYRVLDAQHFGVPQRRRRVVIVGCLGDWAAPVSVLFEPEGRGGHPAPSRTSGSDAAAGTTRVADSARREVVTSIGLSGIGGNGGPDDNAAQGGHLIATTLRARDAKQSPDSDATQTLIAYALRADPAGVGQGHNTNYVPVEPEAYQGQGSNVGPMGTLRAGSGTVAGDVPFVPVGGEIAHALTAEGADASEDGTGRGTPIIAFGHTAGLDSQPSGSATPTMKAGQTSAAGMAAMTSSAVRRLTPTECERLQGYPDGWTAVSASRPQADSPRYKQLGNSIAVPVFEWVAHHIVRHS